MKLDPNTILSNLNYQMSNGKLKVTFNSTSDDVTEPNTIEINNVNNEQQKVLMKETQEFVKQIEKKQLAIHNLSRGPSKGGSDGSNRER